MNFLWWVGSWILVVWWSAGGLREKVGKRACILNMVVVKLG